MQNHYETWENTIDSIHTLGGKNAKRNVIILQILKRSLSALTTIQHTPSILHVWPETFCGSSIPGRWGVHWRVNYFFTRNRRKKLKYFWHHARFRQELYKRGKADKRSHARPLIPSEKGGGVHRADTAEMYASSQERKSAGPLISLVNTVHALATMPNTCVVLFIGRVLHVCFSRQYT